MGLMWELATRSIEREDTPEARPSNPLGGTAAGKTQREPDHHVRIGIKALDFAHSGGRAHARGLLRLPEHRTAAQRLTD